MRWLESGSFEQFKNAFNASQNVSALTGLGTYCITSNKLSTSFPATRWLIERSLSVTFSPTPSVTRLGDLLHFGQIFKACRNNYFTQIAHKSKSLIFLVKSFLGNFYRHLATFLLVTLPTPLNDFSPNLTKHIFRFLFLSSLSSSHSFFRWLSRIILTKSSQTSKTSRQVFHTFLGKKCPLSILSKFKIR